MADQPDNAPLSDPIDRCGANDAFLNELGQVYADVDSDLAGLALRCMGGGVCCRFDVAGHRLFVTTGELAYLIGPDGPPQPSAPGHCPYQLGPRCTQRQRRPLGCRVYFCDDAAAERLADLYQRHHRRIVGLHERLGVTYRYVELTGGLAELSRRGQAATGGDEIA